MTNTLAPELEQKPDDVDQGTAVETLLTLARARWEAGRADQAFELLEPLAATGTLDSGVSQLREAILSERAALQSYLDHGLAARGVDCQVVERVREVWAWLGASFTHLPLPSVGPRFHGGADLTWRIGGWVVEVEFFRGDEEAESGWWIYVPELGASLAGSLDERARLRAGFAAFLSQTGTVVR